MLQEFQNAIPQSVEGYSRLPEAQKNAWAEDYAAAGHMPINAADLPPNQWADEFGAQGSGQHAIMGDDAHSDSLQNKWADEFSNPQMQAGGSPQQQAASRADALQQTKALRDTLASSQDPKFQQSKFLQFVYKMSRGEIILEDNQVGPTP